MGESHLSLFQLMADPEMDRVQVLAEWIRCLAEN
jgi:hypothetical protein